jgi:hypothetical protein
VDAGIEHLDDLAFDLDAVGNVDDVAEDAADLSAIEVLPLPGGPYSRIERPELIAGPTWRTNPSEITRLANARSIAARSTRSLVMRWRWMRSV